MDIKKLLDNIIQDKPSGNMGGVQYRELPTFDKREWQNKLSMLVLKDIIHGMLRDETSDDMNNMVDYSINKYLSDNAFEDNDAYNYINRCRDRLSSPMLGDLIQELDDACEEISDRVKDGEQIDIDNYDIKDVLKNVENYDQLREKLKDIVSKKVVRDVTKTIVKTNDAPTFNDLDDKIAQTSDAEIQESLILDIAGQIYAESYKTDETMNMDKATQQAIVEYCVSQMSYLFKQYPQMDIYREYEIKPLNPA